MFGFDRGQQLLSTPSTLSAPADYLSSLLQRPHRGCSNHEGWGPGSPGRFDLTPCFLDVWVVVLSAFGIICGLLALWYMLRRRKPHPVGKNWHFYLKLSLIAALAVTTAIQAALQIEYWPGVWVGDFRFWASITTLISLIVIFSVQYVEHWRARVPNGVVLFYWLLFIIVYAVKLRSLVSQQFFKKHLAYFVTFCISLSLAIFEFLIEWLVPKKKSQYESLIDEYECPYDYADIFSVLSFGWMTSMMKQGYKEYLTQEDMWDLRKRDTTEACQAQFDLAWSRQLERKSPSLWIAMFSAFGGPYLRGAILKSGSDVLNFAQPQLLKYLILFVESYSSDTPQTPIRGAALALAMFVVSVGQTVFLHQYFQRAFETGMRVKAALTSAIYDKALRLSNEGRAAKSSGDIVNHMAVDTQRLQDLTQFGQMLWSAPLQIVLCLASLYQMVGLSMLAGIGVMVLMIPINWLIARIMRNLQKEQMVNKDTRTRLMTEILNNMKSIKLFAWGQAFMNRLNHVRNDLELRTLRKIGVSQSFANFTWSTTPFLVSCSTFVVFVVVEKKTLTTDIVFPALTLFNLLTFPLTVLPMVISSIIEASVAVSRLNAYFAAEELQEDAVTIKPPVDSKGENTVEIKNGTFTWTRYEDRNALEKINFVARKGELSCIVGRVGTGKSSFLQSILGDLWKVEGKVTVSGKVAYVAQAPWVMNATVKENILFGHQWDPQFYDRTVKACALTEDFASLPDGDQTEVGERGIALSGGQKARLTLARAVYARADIYLLDDVLSAVDGHVGRHIINNVLGANGLLQSKTRILATNSIPVLYETDYVALIKDRRIVEEGKFNELLEKRGGEVANLIRTANNEERQELDSTESEKSKTLLGSSPESEADEIAKENLEQVPELPNIQSKVAGSMTRKASNLSLQRARTASFHGPRGKITDEEAPSRTKQAKESSEQGKVKWKVYAEYAKTSNLFAVAIYLITLVAAQVAQVMSSVWLKVWSEANAKYGGNADVGKFIGIYFAIGIGSAILVVTQALILWIFCTIEAARKLHQRMAHAIFRAPMSFFETTPVGRILNRFSSDIYRVDEVLARSFNMLFVNTARALATFALISASTPVFVVLIFPLGFVYYYVQKYYLRTSRELKRLDSVSRSPIFAHFQESLNGISTIRAYRQQPRFSLESQWRVDENLKAYFPSISANRWLAIRLEFIGSVTILAAATFAIISVTAGSGLSAGLIGLAMSYALQINQSLNWIVRQTVEVETNIVSVERILEYAALPSEAPEIISKNRPPISWPAHGAVSFKNYSTRYRQGLDLVLKDVNVDIKAHEKIGVLGRTGAGKSSLTLALFRIIEPASGQIDIDGMNTSAMGLLDLRRRLAIIPQDAALFEGTVRSNLDPAGVHDDTELWSVLDQAYLKDHVASMAGQLDAKVNEGGSNLSQGQRQLVSMARALLTPSNILVLDEATAAVDIETDQALQKLLRSSVFRDRTIITIAHRINTVLDSDRILVLSNGKVAEMGTPAELKRQKGLFYKLVEEAGLLDSVTGDGN